MTDETPLLGGREHEGQVVRVGHTVRRPIGPWTSTVHAFLRHLRTNGFTDCPDVLGIDEQGREILTYIDGDVIADPDWDGGPVRWPATVRADETLAAIGDALRRMHDAARSFVPPEPRPWRQFRHELLPGQIVCHADIGPWNTVYDDHGFVAFIDWDAIRPDDPEMDWATAAWNLIPLADDGFLRGTGWDEPPDVAARLRVFCDSYGIGDADRVVDLLFRSKERYPSRFRWWPIGPAESASLFRETADELEWLAANATRLQRALQA